MAKPARNFDCLIFGGGLAGSILAWTLLQKGKRPLVIDCPGKSRCSRVAAGLINPIGGKRLNLVWEADRQIPFAKDFYKNVGEYFRKIFFSESRIARLFANKDEEQIWRKKKGDPEYAQWAQELSEEELSSLSDFNKKSGIRLAGAGILDIPQMLMAIRLDLQQSGFLESSEFFYQDIHYQADSVEWNDCAAPIAIFAEGHLATQNPWFSFIPYKPAKGVIGRIHSDIQLSHLILVDGKFLIPHGDGSITIGATYDWDRSDDEPDPEKIGELETFATKQFGNHWKWIDVSAGVRPTIPGAMPAVGPHPQFSNLFSFNGFGSKGATQAPCLAKSLFDFIWKGIPLPREVVPARFHKETNALPKRWIAVEIARDRVLNHINPGDTVVDATAGNGHDTLWLAKAVGSTGIVYAFDIQKSAIDIAKERLNADNGEVQTTFIHACHSKIAKLIPAKVQASAIVFNLGYLPKGNKSIITKADTTITALNQSLSILKPGGILSMVIYPGHHGGENESIGVLEFFKRIDPNCYKTEIVTNPAENPKSPYLLFAVKR